MKPCSDYSSALGIRELLPTISKLQPKSKLRAGLNDVTCKTAETAFGQGASRFQGGMLNFPSPKVAKQLNVPLKLDLRGF